MRLKTVSLVCIGYILGVLLHHHLSFHLPEDADHCENSKFDAFISIHGLSKSRHLPTLPSPSNIYVGMMSAGKYITSRVQPALDSWLQRGGWKVEAYADPHSSILDVPYGLDFNIVNLLTVDDAAYPPQKKAFMMLRHMYDHHINDYDWFIRVDDDVYVDYERLSVLLNSLNSSMPLFFGTPGFGIDEDDGMEEGMYYLMGGPGMIFSRQLLVLLRPHIQYCIRHMFSPHEDVEMGRCVWKYVKEAKIPVAWEVIELFFQQYDKNTGDVTNVVLQDLTELQISKPVSYHAVKNVPLLNGLHNKILTRKISQLVQQTSKLRCEVDAMMALIDMQHIVSTPHKENDDKLKFILPGSDDEILRAVETSHIKQLSTTWPTSIPWLPSSAMFTRSSSTLPWVAFDKYYRHQADRGVPARGHQSREQRVILDVIEHAKQNFVKESCPDFPTDGQFLNGYFQVHPHTGVMYHITFKAFVSGGEKCCSVHAYQPFGAVLSREPGITSAKDEKQTSLLNNFIGRFSPGREQDVPQDGINYNRILPSLPSLQDRLVFIMPVYGRYQTLEHFLEGYKRHFLLPIKQQRVSNPLLDNVLLVIVTLGSDDAGINHAIAHLLQTYQNEYGTDLIQYHVSDSKSKTFSRGASLQMGSLLAKEDDILFFIDVDMAVSPSLASQCRRHVSKSQFAWYPIPFSQYDPDRLCIDESGMRSDVGALVDDVNINPAIEESQARAEIARTPFAVGEERGFWRNFGYGITCMYKSDFAKAGGFDLTIEGWGEEDVRLYRAVLKSGTNAFRSNEAELIHIFHHKYCSSDLVGEQARACQSTKKSHYASQKCLSKTYFQKHEL